MTHGFQVPDQIQTMGDKKQNGQYMPHPRQISRSWVMDKNRGGEQ